MTQHTPSTVSPLTGPPLEPERHFLDRQCEAERWFSSRWLRAGTPRILAALNAVERLLPDCRGVPIIPQDHTRNQCRWRAGGNR
ncbi:MAG: hypothetical protein WB783_11475 [Arenicellales bacterium]|jgi:hypothetical protein